MFGVGRGKNLQEAGDPGAWTVYDRIEEARGKLTLKRRDQEAYYAFSQQKIKENEELIASLRGEIKEKQILQKRSLNADEYVIREGFRKNRESQLAMQRYTVENAVTEKNEHVFDKAGQLNMARHSKCARSKKCQQLLLTLRDLKCAARTNDEDKSSQRVRILTTSLDKMLMKCGTARFIQKTYRQILFHLERDGLTLPGRLDQLESNLQSVRHENQVLVQIQTDAKSAYDLTKTEKEQLETGILRSKRSRDTTLAQTRRKFKKLNQRSQDKDYKPKKKSLQKTEVEHKSARRHFKGKQFWAKVRVFWGLKRAMDNLQQQMCVHEPENIAAIFKKQIQRNTHLHKLVDVLREKKSNLDVTDSRMSDGLSKVKQSHQELIQETSTRSKFLLDSQDAWERRRDRAEERLERARDNLRIVTSAIGHLLQKVEGCDWIAHELLKKQVKLETLMGGLDGESPNVVAALQRFGERIEILIKWVAAKENEVCEDQPVPSVRELLATDGAQEMLVVMGGCVPMNTRIVIQDDEDILPAEDFLCDDDDANDKYLSRDVIKSALKQLSDVGVRKRRKRPKAKN